MDNIVMATLARMPMADGTATATAAGSADGGQFGSLVDAEFALLTGEGKGGHKLKTGEGNNSLAALLLASLIQGLVPKDGKDDEAVSDEAGAAAVQAQTGAGASTALDDLTQVLANINFENGASKQDIRAALTALLKGGGGIQTASADAVQQFSELLSALQSSVQGDAVGAAYKSAAAGAAYKSAAAGAAYKSAADLKALTEIRKLFSEIVSKAENGGATEGPGNAQAARVRQINEILARIDGLIQGGNDAADTAARPVVTIALDTGANNAAESGAGETDLSAGTAAADGTDHAAPADRKKEPTDFSAALRAYRGDGSGGTAPTAAPRENSAAMALRQGEQAFDTIVEKIASLQNAGGNEMEIRLKPDFLGHVVIKLTMGEGGLTASIAASNPKVQDAFMSQISALQNSLAEQGLKDVRVVVTSSSVQDAALQQQQLSQGRGQSRQEKHKRHMPEAITSLNGASVSQPLLAYEQAYRTGLVNRLA